MNHKKAEDEIISELFANKVFGNGDIKKCLQEYSKYDAYIFKECIIEIKDRKTKEGCRVYDSLEIEFDKYSYNIEFSRYGNVNFYYVCRYEGSIFIFDITNLSQCNYYFKWEWVDRPKTTAFGRKELVKKYVAKLPIKLAWETIPLI